MKLPKVFSLLLSLIGCGPKFVDTTTQAGIPNLVQVAPGMWRMGQPPDADAWRELALHIAPNGQQVLIIKMNDEKEGDDSPAVRVLGWTVERKPLPPEDDKPWTVLVKPNEAEVKDIVQLIMAAHHTGLVVAWHCSHGRDRTGLVSALVGRKLFGWTKDQAWDDMLKHGFRWELPDLDAFWLEDVPAAKR
jgi:hypothetical protein